MSKYITLNDVEVTDITVRVDIEDILGEATEASLIEALQAYDYDGAAFLEAADADALWEALGDKEESDLLDLLDKHNMLEAATRFWLDNLSDNDREQFLRGAGYVKDAASIPELVFVADSPTAPVHWVRVEGAEAPCGMILPDLANIMEGRAKLRMFLGLKQEDTGWIDCNDMPAAQRLARTLHAGHVVEQRRAAQHSAQIERDAATTEVVA